MDLMNYSIKEYHFIFRSTEYKDHYIIFFDSENFASRYFEQVTRSGPKYGVLPADGVPYGYPHFPLEKVLQVDATQEFVDYLRNTIAKEKIESTLGDFGWYILEDPDIEKWKALYQMKISAQRKLLQEVARKEKKVEQIKIF